MKKQILTIVISFVAATMATAQLKVTSIGNVGINNSNPIAGLDLGTGFSGKPPLLLYNNDNSGIYNGTKAGFFTEYFGGNNLNLVFAEANSTPGLFTISGKNTAGTTLNQYFSVAGLTGNVGIGASPTSTDKLYVNGHSVLQGGTLITAGYAPYNIALEWYAPGNYPVIYGGSNNVLFIGKSTNWCNHVWSTTIDVSDFTYTNIYHNSDKRLKSNIKGLANTLPLIKKMKSYSYNFNQEFVKTHNKADTAILNKQQFGFIAQELKDILPELVVTDDSTGYLKVDYVSMIPIIVEAIKEQSKTIDSLKNNASSIDSLKAQITTLTNLVADVQNCCNSKGTSKTKAYVESETETSIATTQSNTQTSAAKLYQNAPNPFKESTTIKLEISETVGSAMVCIYDLTGRQLKCISATGRGTTSVQIFANELSAGLYHYALITDGSLIDTKTMVLTE